MATKQKLSNLIAKALHRHNRQRFEEFHRNEQENKMPLSKPAKYKPIRREDFAPGFDFDEALENDPRFMQFDHEALEMDGMTLEDVKSFASWDVDDFNDVVANDYPVNAWLEDE